MKEAKQKSAYILQPQYHLLCTPIRNFHGRTMRLVKVLNICCLNKASYIFLVHNDLGLLNLRLISIRLVDCKKNKIKKSVF